MFYVAIRKIMKEKAMAMNIPEVAPRRNSLSDAPQAMNIPPWKRTFFIASGISVVAFQFLTNSTKSS